MLRYENGDRQGSQTGVKLGNLSKVWALGNLEQIALKSHKMLTRSISIYRRSIWNK